jgi:hypothetical protein
MCVFNIVGLVRPGLVFNKAASLNLYLHPRSRKIRSKIGIELFVCEKNLLCFMKHAIGLADDCLVRQNRMPGGDCPRSKVPVSRETLPVLSNNTTKVA